MTNWLIWKDPDARKYWSGRRGQQRMRWLDGITNSMDVSLSPPGVGDGQGGLACCSSRGLKELDMTHRLNWTELMKVKVESEKADLKPNIQKTKSTAFSPITSWQIDRETMETVTDFILFCSKITADGDYIHEIKRCLLLGRKAMTNLDSILRSRDIITLPTKVHLVKGMVFLVVMYGCESWTIKNTEHWRMMLLNSGVGEASWEFLGLQRDQNSQY